MLELWCRPPRLSRPRPSRSGELRLVVVSNAPAPYNDALFREVARQPGVALQVLYGAFSESHRAWQLASEKGYGYEVLRGFTLGGATHLNAGVVGALRSFAPDVAILSGSYTMPTMQLAAAALGARGTPWLYWGEEIAHGPAAAPVRVARALLRRTLRRARGVLAIGSRARMSYARAGVDPERIADFRYYADTDRFALSPEARAAARTALRASLGVTDETCVVLYAGQLVPRKGVDTLLHAVAHLGGGGARPSPVLLIAGDGPERAALEALVGSLGIRGRVRWLGFRQPSELPGVFAAADVFTLPSHAEGWGVVVTEAMAAGLPVLASDRVNAAADLVRDGENGALFRVGDDVELADRLGAVARDDAYRAALGAEARATVRTESPSVAAPRLIRLVGAARAGAAIADI